jgi:Phage integrase family
MGWAYRADIITADPMTRLDRTQLPIPAPRPIPTSQVIAVLGAIPKSRDRDRLLFHLIYTTGLRIGEALSVEVDHLDLTRDDEHVTIRGKGGRRRTVLLDDPSLVAMLRRYLRARGYRHGPLFRAEKNHVGGPLRYASARALWANYRTKAQVTPQSTSCGMSTPPSWSTPGCPWRRFAVNSVTRTPKQFSATPSRPTPPPTRRSAPGAAEPTPSSQVDDLPQIRTVSWPAA